MSPSSRYSLGVLHGHRALVLGGVEEADVGVLAHWGERWRDGGSGRAPVGTGTAAGGAKPCSSPEILIFFTVLLVLLVTWTLTLMGSPW